MSVQEAAGASQSVTLPCVSVVVPELTEATNVNTVPEGTVAPNTREFVPAAMARLVVVGTDIGLAIALYGNPKITDKKTAASPTFPGPKAILHCYRL